MCVLAKDMATSITITGTFAGTYIFDGHSVYWLDGTKNKGMIHFTVNHGGNETFVSFHITYSISGTNIGIWYNKGVFGSVNAKNLPIHKQTTWDNWWAANKPTCQGAANQFWNTMNTCP